MRFRRPALHSGVIRLATTHFVVDGYANIYAPLLPLLIPRLHLTLAVAGLFVSLTQVSGSISQLVFGRLADRWRPRVLVIAGPFLGVAVLSLVGAAATKAQLAAVLVVGGIGGAAFHPAAAAAVNRLGGRRRGFAMSVHITAGSVGYALAPLVFAPFAERVGLGWTPLLALPGLIALGLLARGVPEAGFRSDDRGGSVRSLRPYARPLALLYAIVVLRTLVSSSFATFVPVLLTRRGSSVAEAGAAAAVYLFAGASGGFVGGPLADRFGARRVIVWSLVGAVVPLALVPSLDGWRFVVVLAIGAFLLQSTLPVNITFAHAIAPVAAGTVSSLMMGVAWGMGGLLVLLVGLTADALGLDATLSGLALLPLGAALCAAPLPARVASEAREDRAPRPASERFEA